MIYITPGYEHLKINVTYSYSPVTDIFMRIYDEYWSLRDVASTPTDDEFFEWYGITPGFYYIEITGMDSGNTYDLLWETYLVDDPYEENDGPFSAYDISGYINSWIYGFQFDEDWYNFTVNPWDERRLIIDLWFNHYDGNIDITLYSPILTPIKWSRSPDRDHEHINHLLPNTTLPITYYINISGLGWGNYYDLWFDLVPFDDQYEDNDNWFSAKDISANESIYHDGRQADDDWYKIYVDVSETRLQVDVNHNDDMGQIEFEIFYYDGVDPNNNKIAWTDYESIHINVLGGAWYYIHINGTDTGNHYGLYWNTFAPFDDNYEPNDNIGIEAEVLYFDWLHDGLGVQLDEDWYVIKGVENHLYVEAYFLFPLISHDLEIWYEDAPGIFSILWGVSSTGYNLVIDVDLPKYGDYYILVNGPNYGIEYDLWWSLGEGDDYFEENDDFSTAAEIYPNYYWDLWIVNDDEDWYNISLNVNDFIEVSIIFDHIEGDLQLELYNPNNNRRAWSDSNDNDEYLSFSVFMSGNWSIRVFHEYGNTRVYYELDIWVNGGGDDQYEENDIATDAYNITSYEGFWIAGMQFDVDWFKFDIGEGVETLVVDLNYNDFEGDINIEVFDSLSNIVGNSNDRTGNEHIEVKNPVSGTYYIRVHGVGHENWYDLYWSSGGEVYYGDDYYEDNDEMSKAYGLWDNEQTWLSDIAGLAVQGNDDWYMIDVTPHFLNVVIELEFNFSQGEINFELYYLNDNNNDIYIGEGVNVTDVNHLVLNTTVRQWGEFFIRVWGNDFENEYDLWWDDVRTDFGEDAYEQNDNFINATDIIDREHLMLEDFRGFGVQYDSDWFEIFIGPDQSLPFILIVDLYYDSAEGLIGIEVYDDELSRKTGNFTMEDNDFIVYRLQSNGTYYIKVFGDNSGNVYDLIWNTKDHIPIEDIPGYDILILLGSIFGVASVVILKWKRSKYSHK